MNEVVAEILEALRKAGPTGLHINELASELEMESQSISTTITQMTSKGLIEMANSNMEERYVIGSEMGQSDVNPRDLNGCPCFHCLKIGKCGIRQPDSPVACKELEDWMISTDS